MRKIIFTQEEREKIIQEYKNGKGGSRICEETGLNERGIYRVLKEEGLSEDVCVLGRKRNKINKILNEDEKMIVIKKYNEGKSANSISKEMIKNRKLIIAFLKDQGVVFDRSRLKKHTINHNAFSDAKNNPDAAYWVGMLMSDGCMSHSKAGAWSICLGLMEIDHEHVMKFQKFLGSTRSVTKRKNGKSNNAVSSISISSKQIIIDLKRYGMTPRKSLTAEVKLLENNLHYWRGMIDGDGSLGFANHGTSPILNFCGSLRSVEQFANFAEKIIHKRPRIYKANVWQVKIYGRHAQKLISLMYENCTVFLERKMEIAKKILDWKSKRFNWEGITRESLEDLKEEYKTWKRVSEKLGTTEKTVIYRYKNK